MGGVEYIIKCSGGNDSIALLWWAHKRNLKNCHVVHNDTGWASEAWKNRMFDLVQPFIKSLGFGFSRIACQGMEAIVTASRHSAWPSRLNQFCTTELKIVPYQFWLRENLAGLDDPIVMVGVRRAESARRATWPEWVEESPTDLGFRLYSPLCCTSNDDRDAMVRDAGFQVLPHRSRECSPCINCNKTDLCMLGETEIAKVERIEGRLLAKRGKHRPMFRAKKHKGAIGIRNIIKWAHDETFVNDELDIPLLCDAGMCGD